MTVWGIGTGRCGTATLAHTCCGLHEPRPWIHEVATKYYWGRRDQETLEALARALTWRHRQPREVVVDLKQSLVIDLIVDIDPDAYFVWLVREPKSAVRSFMSYEYFCRQFDTEPLKALRYEMDKWRTMPEEGIPEDWSLPMTCMWYWNEMNTVIFETLKKTGAPFEILLTTELGNRKYNPIELAPGYEKVEKVFYDLPAIKFYEEMVFPFWGRIVNEREKIVGS